jgi:hypothetical protein
VTDADQHVKRRHESPELKGASARMMRALAKRAGEGDVEALEALDLLRADLDAYTHAAVGGLRHNGYSWSAIAAVLGISRQGAQQRFGGVGR